MGLHARLDAKAATFIGLVTLVCAVFLIKDWGIISSIFLALAGGYMVTRKPQHFTGISVITTMFFYGVLVFIGLFFSPVSS
ncbi:hypothetical protein [Haladaptatus sp. DYF46]|uniref:hypothetical protein n=1 Tax=Haladaptatus sp. DYF46 TaxID=2886041 RepID=UPI001E4AA3C9|nr:hypothetical protein [Haladaptatus sp. DYF46]